MARKIREDPGRHSMDQIRIMGRGIVDIYRQKKDLEIFPGVLETRSRSALKSDYGSNRIHHLEKRDHEMSISYRVKNADFDHVSIVGSNDQISRLEAALEAGDRAISLQIADLQKFSRDAGAVGADDAGHVSEMCRLSIARLERDLFEIRALLDSIYSGR